MKKFIVNGKLYQVDSLGFLLDPADWDESFAEKLAPTLNIAEKLSYRHWNVIYNIRSSFKQTGRCPLVYETCKACQLRLKDCKRLFPAGYLQGACKLAGLTYRDAYVKYSWPAVTSSTPRLELTEKVYRVNVLGFLVDPCEWDENFAIYRALDMKISGGLTDKHWKIIHYIRDSFSKNEVDTTVYETGEVHHIELEELEKLFPDGYHRGAVKMAGLRVL